ncbi:ISL3 family transposase [Streptomyces sp. NBC_00193]|uniref:ISL3 family transposase n=1 Tax=Streptomyces sp. NBC_00193 TaxID=2975675 RepID=UPI0022591279|nr:ISL3 family transposase [Streptomyces sp. NBC_00193]MCX5300428.1 ISL3 family transposase [Streptomyces sp. NBC_00193]
MEVVCVEASGPAVRVEARLAALGAACPGCGVWSERVHGSYLRYPSDLPSCGRPMVVALRVRRFICAQGACPRRTFVEQADGLTRWNGQVTERQRASVAGLGLALAGRSGARMAALLGIRTSRSTLLRRVMDLSDPAVGAPVAVGVDDFALRRGHVYGTVITDAVTHEVLDLLPDRDAASLAPWLARHPQIDVICRDRASAYADAASTAAPRARQVADRYHLWANLVSAVEKTVVDHRQCLHTLPTRLPEADPQWETPDPEQPVPAEPAGKMAERRRLHHALVHDLLGQGLSERAVARHLGWSRNTVRRYARAGRWQDMMKRRPRPRASILDPYKPYLEQRWAETGGKITGLTLLAEIRERGYRGGHTVLAVWKQGQQSPDQPAPSPAPPTVRAVVGWLTRHPAGLTLDEELQRKALLARCPELETTADLVRSFAEMLTSLEGNRLPEWITQAMTSGLRGISTFANGLNSDYDAVEAGLTTPWNSGHVEGAVNRIKMLKRQMFGRAGFPLLRKRVLLA